MKNIKGMIIPILVGFTLMTSIYSTIKIRGLEDDVSKIDLEMNLSFEDDISSSKREIRHLENVVDDLIRLDDYDDYLRNELRKTENIVSDLESDVSDLEDELSTLKRELQMNLNIILN